MDRIFSYMEEQIIIEGFISVRAVLKSGNRPIFAIFIRTDKYDRGVSWLEHEAKRQGIPVKRINSDVIDSYAGGATHGGILAHVGPRRLSPLDAIAASDPAPFVAMLDGVEDPFNFGQAIRALYAAGANGVIVRSRSWIGKAAGVVARSSAGASEWTPMAEVDSVEDAAEHFRARGLLVACAAKQDATPIYETDLTVPLFLVIGGERRGITRSFLDQADLKLAIPYATEFDEALGTTAAAAVLAFEVMRQRRHQG
jgi:23S rRNA (guanosine2251-2'-O)-methyltransferase